MYSLKSQKRNAKECIQKTHQMGKTDIKRKTEVKAKKDDLKMNLTDLKIYGLNISAFALSLTELELFLKIAVLLISIGYTINKWYLMNQKK
jgi:hypothetical protein